MYCDPKNYFNPFQDPFTYYTVDDLAHQEYTSMLVRFDCVLVNPLMQISFSCTIDGLVSKRVVQRLGHACTVLSIIYTLVI
jgi:hypothetical protein